MRQMVRWCVCDDEKANDVDRRKKVALKQEKVVMARGLPLSRLSHDNYIHFYFYLENYVRSLSSYRQLHSIPSDA